MSGANDSVFAALRHELDEGSAFWDRLQDGAVLRALIEVAEAAGSYVLYGPETDDIYDGLVAQQRLMRALKGLEDELA